MKGSTQRFLSLVASLGILVAGILVFSLLLVPSYREINKLRGELISKSQALESQQTIVDNTKKLLNQYQSDLSSFKNSISLAMPIGSDYPSLVNQLASLSKAFGLLLVSVDFNLLPISLAPANRNLPVTGTVQVKMQMRGTYQSFKDFLTALESNIRIMDVISFNIIPDERGQNFSYFLIVNTYYQSNN